MTREHLGLCLALAIPMFCVITRIDSCPGSVYDATLDNVQKLFKSPRVKKRPYLIRSHEDVVFCAKIVRDDVVVPVFSVSNVTGESLNHLRHFLNLLPIRSDWEQRKRMPAECIIDQTYSVPGVGTVVSGMVTQGSISAGSTVHLGPDSLGHFRQVGIRTIHVQGAFAKTVEAGTHAGFALKKETRDAVRKGMAMVGLDAKPQATWEFEAEIVVLFHATTIATGYQPVIHCKTVRQSARITLVQDEHLRTGDKALVRFRFKCRPEYITLGSKIVFREGRTKGMGTVTQIFPDAENAKDGSPKNRNKNRG